MGPLVRGSSFDGGRRIPAIYIYRPLARLMTRLTCYVGRLGRGGRGCPPARGWLPSLTLLAAAGLGLGISRLTAVGTIFRRCWP